MLDIASNPGLNAGLHNTFLILILVSLEAVLSADNAVALAAIAQGLKTPELQRRALNFGLVAAYVLRMLLILTATWVIQFWQFEFLGALYLLWLCFSYFFSPDDPERQNHNLGFNSLWQAIPVIALTDLAFSLDSVTAAVAVADRTWLIIAGGTIGVITLRFLAGVFIRWLDIYTHLKDAGFIAVGIVGVRLMLRAVYPALNPPEWVMISAIAMIFVWGFSERIDATPVSEAEE